MTTDRADWQAMSARETAAWLQLSESTVKDLTDSSRLPYSALASRRRYWQPTLIETLFPQVDLAEVAPDDCEVIDPGELAHRLGVSRQTARRLVESPFVPSVQFTRAIRILWPPIRHRLEEGLPLAEQ